MCMDCGLAHHVSGRKLWVGGGRKNLLVEFEVKVFRVFEQISKHKKKLYAAILLI